MQIQNIKNNTISEKLNYIKSDDVQKEFFAPKNNNNLLIDYLQKYGKFNYGLAFKGRNKKIDYMKDLNNISIFDDVNKNLIEKVLAKLKITNIEYDKKDNITNIYLRNPHYTYNMNLIKTDENVIFGMVNKEYKNGNNELFVARFEFINTNKSDKLKIVHMPVLLSDLSEKSIEFIGKLDEKFINDISTKLLFTNSKLKQNTVYSVDKQTGIMTCTGAMIGNFKSEKIKQSEAGNSISKREKWDLVVGPHGKIFKVPRYINMTINGVSLNSLKSAVNDCLSDKYEQTRDPMTLRKPVVSLNENINEYISKKEDLESCIEYLIELLNGCYVFSHRSIWFKREKFYTLIKDGSKEKINNIVKVFREMLKAEIEYNKVNTSN